MNEKIANDLIRYAELVEDAALISPEEMNCASLMRLAAEVLAQPEHEKERCVGCEACIDTACGRDECPKGWPKAAQPEQEPVAYCDIHHLPEPCVQCAKEHEGYNIPPQPKEPEQGPDVYIPADALRQLKGTSLLILRSVPLYGYRGDGLTPLYTIPPQRKLLTDEQWMIEMVDAAMVATRDIVPRITRSQCRLIIEAAHGIKGDA